MKVRLDFVTNSSSSSFILGKPKEYNLTVEDVYKLLRDLYLKYNDLVKKAMCLVDSNSEIPIIYKKCESHTQEDYVYFTLPHAIDMDYNYRKTIIHQYDTIFGFDWYLTNFPVDADWFSCQTYQEYQKYFSEKMKEETIEAPFAICDLRDKDGISWITADLDQKQDLTTNSEIFEWYCCDDFEENILPEYTKETNNPLFEFLGQICIYSECGYIPDVIVEELMRICEHGCNHMG